jgi:hypothetical protein
MNVRQPEGNRTDAGRIGRPGRSARRPRKTAMTPASVRLFYVDDSGAEDTGFAVYAWVECAIGDWRAGLSNWLDLRRDIYAAHGIPPAYELHATKFIRGTGNPSTNPAWNRRKHHRSQVVQRALATLGGTPELKVGAAYRRTAARGTAYQAQREQLYGALAAHFDPPGRGRGVRHGLYGR